MAPLPPPPIGEDVDDVDEDEDDAVDLLYSGPQHIQHQRREF